MDSTLTPSSARQRARWELAGALGVVLVCGVFLPFLRLEGLLLVAAAAAALVALAWFRPAVWLLLVFLLPYSVELDYVLGGASLTLPTEALVPGLIAAHIAACLLSGRLPYARSPLNLPIVVFFGAIAATLLVTRDTTVTTKAVVRDLGYAFVGYYLAAQYIRRRRFLVWLLGGIVAGNALLALYGIGTQVQGGFHIYGNIAGPFFENHCIYAAHLAVIVAGLFAVLVSLPRGLAWRAPAWVALGIMTLAVGLSFVRGAWLSLIAAGLLAAIVSWRRIRPSAILGGGMLLLVLTLGVGAFEVAELFSQRFDDAFNPSYVTNYDRIDRWLTALAMWSDHPLLGVGWGRYGDEYVYYYQLVDAYSTEIRMGAHNLYLEVLAEAGLVGLAVYLWLLLVAWCEARRLWRTLKDPLYRSLALAVWAGLVTLIVHLVVNNLSPSDKIGISFWLLLGLLPALERLDREGNAERQPVDVARTCGRGLD